jgi:hypothetical protein
VSHERCRALEERAFASLDAAKVSVLRHAFVTSAQECVSRGSLNIVLWAAVAVTIGSPSAAELVVSRSTHKALATVRLCSRKGHKTFTTIERCAMAFRVTTLRVVSVIATWICTVQAICVFHVKVATGAGHGGTNTFRSATCVIIISCAIVAYASCLCMV